MSKNVTQADRDAAANILELFGRYHNAHLVRAGELDVLKVVQIVAAHRRASVAALEARIAELEQWKAAIDEALVCNHLGTADDFPNAQAALQRLIGWEVSMALDPEISVDARSLQAKATAKLEAENARLRKALMECGRATDAGLLYTVSMDF
jgi:BMFP domain-containing protein YqiC